MARKTKQVNALSVARSPSVKAEISMTLSKCETIYSARSSTPKEKVFLGGGPYVCPKPVVVIRYILYVNGAKSGVSLPNRSRG
eukprot:COSAG06_NODE_405_length_16132_cov_9.166532_18_plen_83_part_00